MGHEPNSTDPSATNADRQRVRGLLRDFRLLATARNGETPGWVESLERDLDEPARSTTPAAEAITPKVTMPASIESKPDESVALGEIQAAPAPFSSEVSEPAAAPPADPLAEAYFRKGEIYRGKREFKRAVACYSEAVRRSPRFVSALLERGQIYRLARKPEKAIPDFNAVLEIDPRHVEAYLRRGNALVDQGRHDEAIEDYTAAIALAPENATAYLNRALAHARKQDNAQVLHDADMALRLDPNLAAGYMLRGAAYSNRKSHELAIADLNRAVQLDPRNPLALHERGLAFARKGNYPHAILSYSKALALAPTLHVARFNRALAHRLHGRYDLASAEFTTFLQQQPTVAEAYYQRGLAQRALGAIPAALQDFAKALELKPDHGEAAAARLETQQEALDVRPAAPAAPTVSAAAKPAPRPRRSSPSLARPAPTVAPVPRTKPTPADTGTASTGRQPVRLFAGISATAAALLLFASVAASLSSGSPTEFRAPNTVLAQGTVLYKGKPLEGIRVTLHPQFDIGPVKFRPSGVSDAQGRFTLTTGAPNDGAPPGEYVVTFSRPLPDSEDEVDAWRGRHNDPTRSKWRVVVKADAGLEPLQID